MTLAELGERAGRVLINPRTKVGAGVATAIAGGMLVVWHGKGQVDVDPTPGDCDKKPLRNVYRPKRFRVIDRCVTETVTVVEATRERDGDYHVGLVPEHPQLLDYVNRKKQHNLLVGEWVPGDPLPPKVGRSRFRAGERLRITFTLVEDLQHGPKAKLGHPKRGWREAHPVFAVEEVLDDGAGRAPTAGHIGGEEKR